MARQVTGAKLYLAGGHTLQIGSAAVAPLVDLLETKPEAYQRIMIVDGNELMIHWSQVSALQIFSAGK
jgi:hypothetical protein